VGVPLSDADCNRGGRAGLTQIGELSFVVMQAARSSGKVAENVFSTAIAASLISILLNVFIVRGVFAWTGRTPPVQAVLPARSRVFLRL
jgi:hypothetical protein